MAMLLAHSFSAEAQQPKKVFRIGYVSAVDAATDSSRSDAIRLALRDIGYIEGQNTATEYRYSGGRIDQASEVAAELVRLNVDIIVVAGGDPWIRAVQKATKSIPIVMLGVVIDPVVAGMVESLAHPGGNLTGLTLLITELGGKRLELLKEIVPKIGNIAVLYDPANPGTAREIKELLPVAARSLELTVRPWEVRDAGDFARIFGALGKDPPDGLYVLAGPLLRAHGKQIAGFALKTGLPTVYAVRESIDVGGLIYYGPDLTDTYRRIALYVDKILKGVKPAELPIEQPTKFELVINLKAAKQLGLTIPPNVLARADRVIK